MWPPTQLHVTQALIFANESDVISTAPGRESHIPLSVELMNFHVLHVIGGVRISPDHVLVVKLTCFLRTQSKEDARRGVFVENFILQ